MVSQCGWPLIDLALYRLVWYIVVMAMSYCYL